ncbi:MAG: hypothetical protein L0241_14415, partial [Planctomycetia bacterium]|nr:hypothetical protein [Planctomycetia bacterium]
PYISGDGNWVAFFSNASDLVSGVTTSGYQLYLYDRANDSLSLVTHQATDETLGSTTNDLPQYGQLALSNDGQSIVFISEALNLLANQTTSNTFFFPDSQDAFLYDRTTDTISLVSHTPSSNTEGANGFTTLVNISDDGSTVVFHSEATNLFTGQNESSSSTTFDIFLYDIATDSVTLVTHVAGDSDTPTGAADDDLFLASISDDGSRVTYLSAANNLVANQDDPNAPDPTGGLFPGGIPDNDVFYYDASTGTNHLVSHLYNDPTTAGSVSTPLTATTPPMISGDGNYIAFSSAATDLLENTIATDVDQVYLYDIANQSNTIISLQDNSSTPSGGTYASISEDGGVVVFTRYDPSGSDDPTAPIDVVRYTRSDDSLEVIAPFADTIGAITQQPVTAWHAVSADGTTVVFNSIATSGVVTNLTDDNSAQDVFVATFVNTPPAPTQITLQFGDEVPFVSDTFFSQLTTDITDPDRTFIFQLVSGDGSTDNSLFFIQNGQLRTGPNFPQQDQYFIRIRVTDADFPAVFYEQTFVLQRVDAPTDTFLTTQPEVPATSNTFFTQLQTTGPDGRTYVYQLPAGVQDNDFFTISNGQLSTGPNFPTTQETYTVVIQSQDSEFPALVYEETYTFTLINAPSSISLSNDTVSINAPAPSSVGTLSVPSSTRTYSYSLVTGTGDTDNGFFTISGSQLSTDTDFPTGVEDTYSIRVRVT